MQIFGKIQNIDFLETVEKGKWGTFFRIKFNEFKNNLYFDAIVSGSGKILLLPPKEYRNYLQYIRVGFSQVIKSYESILDLYNHKTKKMYTVGFDQFLKTRDSRKFSQYGDLKPRVYSYVDTLDYKQLGALYMSDILGIIENPRQHGVFLVGSKHQTGLKANTIFLNGIPDRYYSFVGNKVDYITVGDAPRVQNANWITGINSNIDGARPYRYKKVYTFNKYLIVGSQYAGAKKDIGEKMIDGIYTILAEAEWKSVQEMGYVKVQDIGNPKRARLTNRYFLVKNFSNNTFEKLALNTQKNYNVIKRNGQRVLYYNKSIQEADTEEFHFLNDDIMKTKNYIKSHWKEIPQSQWKKDELR